MSTDETAKKWTLTQLLKEVPKSWEGYEVAVGTSVSRALAVRRVSLHTNRNGRRLIILHADELHTTESGS